MLALITGGTNGIGADAVERMAGRGFEVIFMGLDEQRGWDLLDALPGAGHVFVPYEAGDEEVWRSMLERYVSDRPLDVLILNAGGGSLVAGAEDPIDLLGTASLYSMFDLNLKDIVVGLRLSLPYLYRAEAPKVIVTNSIAGLVSTYRDPLYSTFKSASIALVRAIAPTLAERGVIIAAVCPGSTLTGMMPAHLVEERADGTLISIRTGSPIQLPGRVTDVFEQIIESAEPGEVWVVDARIPVRLFDAAELWPGKVTV